MKTLIARTVIANIRNRAISQIAHYNVIATDRAYLDTRYTVAHKEDATRVYKVDTFMNTCTCEAFKREGYCKHYSMVQATQADEARYDREAAKLSDPDYIAYTA